MDDTPPTTVLLPTVEWTEACREVAAQLGDEDELLVICDHDDDPVARRTDVPDGVQVIAAGDPEGCSGKANAIATGMERADTERLVWTDDDFHHPDDWLATLQADYERDGPSTEVPFFEGRDPLSVLLEPGYVVSGSLSVARGEVVWGGAVIFERSDIDETAFLDDLRRTISDDGTLTEYLDVTGQRRTRRIPVGGSIRATLERHVRFTQIAFRHGPVGFLGSLLAALVATVGCLLVPLYVVPAVTLLNAAVYEWLGVRRWTTILAVPGMVLAIPLAIYGLARRTFEWGGRRYRWHSMFDVEIV
ncbi:MAG: glycosyltransferase family 2 protein [Halobaculum sp.]